MKLEDWLMNNNNIKTPTKKTFINIIKSEFPEWKESSDKNIIKYALYELLVNLREENKENKK